jgi:hypothetical protein
MIRTGQKLKHSSSLDIHLIMAHLNEPSMSVMAVSHEFQQLSLAFIIKTFEVSGPSNLNFMAAFRHPILTSPDLCYDHD